MGCQVGMTFGTLRFDYAVGDRRTIDVTSHAHAKNIPMQSEASLAHYVWHLGEIVKPYRSSAFEGVSGAGLARGLLVVPGRSMRESLIHCGSLPRR
jgi:hypothetical protein